MVHVGEPPPLYDEVLDILGPGDIVTHCFNGKAGGQHHRGRGPVSSSPSAARARASGSMSAMAAPPSRSRWPRRRSRRGLLPYSISTDLHARSLDSPVWDMGTTMSKLLAVGMPFEEVVEAVTRAPMRVVGLPTEDRLAPGTRGGVHRVRGDRERSAHRRFHGARGASAPADRARLDDPRGGAHQGQPLCSPQRLSERRARGPRACPHCGWAGADDALCRTTWCCGSRICARISNRAAARAKSVDGVTFDADGAARPSRWSANPARESRSPACRSCGCSRAPGPHRRRRDALPRPAHGTVDRPRAGCRSDDARASAAARSR